jgi:hypothetical protein
MNSVVCLVLSECWVRVHLTGSALREPHTTPLAVYGSGMKDLYA